MSSGLSSPKRVGSGAPNVGRRPSARVIITPEAYRDLQKQLDHVMAEVYANRLGEIPDASPAKFFVNSLITARVGDTSSFDFGMCQLPYSFVNDRFTMSGYGSDLSVNVDLACASVKAMHKPDGKGAAWDGNPAFGVEGKYELFFGDLTVLAARSLANGLVDYVKAFVQAENKPARLHYEGREPPFMMAVAGHVLIHDGVTGVTLPDSWTGICVDAADARKHWYIGRSRGERSFSALAAKDMVAAFREIVLLVQAEKDELADSFGAPAVDTWG